jgi:hypothetical protein
MAQNVTDASENLQFWIPLFAVLPPNPPPGYSAFRSIVRSTMETINVNVTRTNSMHEHIQMFLNILGTFHSEIETCLVSPRIYFDSLFHKIHKYQVERKAIGIIENFADFPKFSLPVMVRCLSGRKMFFSHMAIQKLS